VNMEIFCEAASSISGACVFVEVATTIPWMFGSKSRLVPLVVDWFVAIDVE